MNDETLQALVVDDEPGMAAGIRRALDAFAVVVPDVARTVTFRVDSADSGEEALAKIDRQTPDILLLDHKLPGISGLEVLAELGRRNLETLTIMITAYATLETAVAATKRGAYDFLAKPFTPAELKDVVRKAAIRLVFARQARKLAQEKRQVRFEFISVLAHEMKAPLSAVEGYLRIMKDRSVGADLDSYDRMIDRSLIRLEGMRKMILDLLDLTRIESGRKKRRIARVDVAQAARQAIETCAADAAARGIAVELHAQGGAEMDAGADEIEIILNNLVSNAIKYNRDGGRVDIHLAAADGRMTVRVADTGVGMSPEEAGRLFKDFVRIKNDKTRNILGSGLGLSIVKKLADLYDGSVSVTSEADVGSTFTVILPVRAQAPAGTHETPASP